MLIFTVLKDSEVSCSDSNRTAVSVFQYIYSELYYMISILQNYLYNYAIHSWIAAYFFDVKDTHSWTSTLLQ